MQDLQLWSTLLTVGPHEEKALKSSAGWQLLSWIRRIWESFFTGLTVHFGLVPSGQINYPRLFEGFVSRGEAPHVQNPHFDGSALCNISWKTWPRARQADTSQPINGGPAGWALIRPPSTFVCFLFFPPLLPTIDGWKLQLSGRPIIRTLMERGEIYMAP